MTVTMTASTASEAITIHTAKTALEASLSVPAQTQGIIIFAHHAGDNRHNPQNEYIAEMLQREGFGTLLIDLLTSDEERLDVLGKLSYDIPLLAGRLDCAAEWVSRNEGTSGLPIGYFGVGTGAAAALVASLQRSDTLGAIVSRGGRADLVAGILSEIKPPTLFIVESESLEDLGQSQRIARRTLTEKKLAALPGANQFFEEPTTLPEIAELAASWFRQHLTPIAGLIPRQAERVHIDSCSFGRIRVDGKDYASDVLIFPKQEVLRWWRKDNHRVRAVDVREVISRKPELFIVGTGTLGNLKLEQSVHKTLEKCGIRCVEETTEKACVLFNRQTEKGLCTAGAFHLTC